MKRAIRTLSAALLVSMPTLLPAAELRIYQLELNGKAPDVAQFRAALDEKSMPGLRIYTTRVMDDGKVLLDLRRHDLPSPDPGATEPRQVGVLIKGQLSPGGKDSGQWQLDLRIRDCRHSAYIFGEAENKFHPSLTESAFEVKARFPKIGKEAWLIYDTDEQSENARTVYVMQVTE